MKNRGYGSNEEINRELEECRSRLAHTRERRAELEKKRESIHKSMHGLLADYMERLEAEEEKWRDEIARIAPETREAGSGSAGLESEGFARAGRASKALRSATAVLENERMGRES